MHRPGNLPSQNLRQILFHKIKELVLKRGHLILSAIFAFSWGENNYEFCDIAPVRSSYFLTVICLNPAQSNMWVFSRPLAESASSNPTGDMDVCLLNLLCVVR